MSSVLHVLGRAPEGTPEGDLIQPNNCTHPCVGSPGTHILLNDPAMEHQVWCYECFCVSMGMKA